MTLRQRSPSNSTLDVRRSMSLRSSSKSSNDDGLPLHYDVRPRYSVLSTAVGMCAMAVLFLVYIIADPNHIVWTDGDRPQIFADDMILTHQRDDGGAAVDAAKKSQAAAAAHSQARRLKEEEDDIEDVRAAAEEAQQAAEEEEEAANANEAFPSHPSDNVPTDARDVSPHSRTDILGEDYTELMGGHMPKFQTTDAHQAASLGDVDSLAKIFESDPSELLRVDDNGWTPLHESARDGRLDATRFLVEKGADVHLRTNHGKGSTPLALALANLGADHPVVEFLGGHLQRVAHDAAYRGDTVTLKKIDSENSQYLLREDDNGWTPLHESARGGHLDAVQFLLERGADVQLRTHHGKGSTALAIARGAFGEDHPVVELLRSREEPPPPANVHGDSDAHSHKNDVPLPSPEDAGHAWELKKVDPTDAKVAATTGDVATLNKVFKRNPRDLFQADDNGWTPLHESVRAGHLDAVKFLVEKGADVNLKTNHGEGLTALALAKDQLGDEHAVVHFLRSAGAQR